MATTRKKTAKKSGRGGARPGAGRKAKEGTTTVYARLPVRLVEIIDDLAVQAGMTRSDVVREMIEDAAQPGWESHAVRRALAKRQSPT